VKRIVIIEGNVRGIEAESPRQDVLTVDINDVDTDTIAVPSAIGEVIAREAYRKNVRVVVEIGTEETSDGGVTREELIQDLAASREIAGEAQREVDRLNRRLECGGAAFDPEKHITKATVAAWLEDDAEASIAATGRAKTANPAAYVAYKACADATRAIITRINDHKDSP